MIKLSLILLFRIAPLTILLSLTACSSTPIIEANAIPPTIPLPVASVEGDLFKQYKDPWEGFNRRMYYFNAKADQYVLLPLVSGYKTITPDFAETGVKNFFSNLDEVAIFTNSVLQLKPNVAVETLGRFVINSTIGIAGLFDVATPLGLDKQDEDFGQTLGYWGVGPGPYLVLPLLGPSSLRDATGSLIDTATYQVVINEFDMDSEEALFLSFLYVIDRRANVPFRYYASGSPFEYDRMKLLYFKFREIQIKR